MVFQHGKFALAANGNSYTKFEVGVRYTRNQTGRSEMERMSHIGLDNENLIKTNATQTPLYFLIKNGVDVGRRRSGMEGKWIPETNEARQPRGSLMKHRAWLLFLSRFFFFRYLLCNMHIISRDRWTFLSRIFPQFFPPAAMQHWDNMCWVIFGIGPWESSGSSKQTGDGT